VNRAVLGAILAGGPVRILVFGGLKSTRHVHFAAVASNAPSLPARTKNVWVPWVNDLTVLGVVQAVKGFRST